MKASTVYLLLLIAAFLLPACESGQEEPEPLLVPTPARLEGEQYAIHTFRAHVPNVPSEEITLKWDFGDGQDLTVVEGVDSVTHQFMERGIYTVVVYAVGRYTNRFIADTSIRVDIQPPSAFAEIIQGPIDTILSEQKQLTQSLKFSVRASVPPQLLRTEWDFGDGSDLAEGTDQSPLHKFDRAGTFMVRVMVKDFSGLPLGADSVQVTLRFPSFNFNNYITYSKGIYVGLDLEPGHPARADTLWKGPLAIGLRYYSDHSERFPTVAKELFVWRSFVKFDTTYFDTINCAFSNDLHLLKSVFVGVNETLAPDSDNISYSYTLNDLELQEVRPDRLVYRSRSSRASDFVKDIFFKATTPNVSLGSITGDSSFTERPPEAVVVIFR